MIAFVVALPLLLATVLVIFYFERKMASFMQDRLGPTHVGIWGTLQPVADLLKLLQKEDIVPLQADKALFKMAPYIIFLSVLASFAFVPLAMSYPAAYSASAIFFILGILALDVVGILLAGWSSNSKYALIGAMRTAAQVISYEVPIGLCVLVAVMWHGSLNLDHIANAQSMYASLPNYLFGIKGLQINDYGGILNWNILQAPFFIPLFIIYFIAALADCNRAPFDIPEAESELVGGFHTEYSGFRFAVFFLSEYCKMLLFSILAVFLFFGGYHSPAVNIGSIKLCQYTTGVAGTASGYAWGVFWIFSKSFFIMLLQVWVRWTFPRVRIDQLMSLSWKYLTPICFVLMIVCALWKIWLIS
ncbi:MAG: complex I subunit 1 family protein [Cytophagales bacterium]|nr:complex I subunit 1 family protein [Cytophagales bacterium]